MHDEAELKIVRGACPHDCPDTCALEIGVRGERVVSVRGAEAHAHTRGVLCTKVSRYAERTDHPERLLHPLRRAGPKGSGRFEPVGWEVALDEIAARLSAIAARDPEAIVPYSYAGTMGQVQGEGMAARFWHRLGASRLDRTICSSAGGEALALTYGDKVGLPVQHFAASRLILIWGSNPITSSVHFWSIAQEAKRHGARLVAIDPRRSETAERCHEHLALRPGTDGALALALMHELVRLEALDHDYLARHTTGWPALRERALQWPPERAAAVCGLPVGQITALARDWATTRPAAIRLNYGMQRVAGGGSAVRLIAALPCLTGAWRDVGGGLLMSSSGWFNPHRNLAALHRPDLLAGRNPRTLNMSTIGDDLLRTAGERLPDGRAFGPRIEALVVYNSNPVAVAPDSARVVQGFAREDLFTVVLEHFRTDTADYADYLLPATTQLEHLDVHTSYGHTDVLLNRPAIAPRGESRPNTWVFRELARRLGYTEPCFADSDEDLARTALRDPVDFGQLDARGWCSLPVPDAPFADGGFPSADGRAHFDPPGLGVADHVPNHECADSDPALAARYPLAMISPPARHFLNSSFVNVASLRAIEGEPVLEMHPDDAAPRGIRDGQLVRVFNDRGATLCRAVVGAGASGPQPAQPAQAAQPGPAAAAGRARPGVVNGLGIWWRKFGRDGTNVNQLTHQRLTDLGRAPCFYDCLVEVEAAAEPPAVGAAGAAGARAPGGIGPVTQAPAPEPTEPPVRKRTWAALAGSAAAALAAVCLATGCADVGYLWQSAGGHLSLLNAARPVTEVIADPATPPDLRQRLELSQRIREFAVTELKLPDNDSYRRYAELGRPAVIWNVIAAPELSLTLKTWCFPVTGCIGYRGYFDQKEAEALGAQLRREGYDVSVYGVPAYSTLGKIPGRYFADPLLSTFIRYNDGELARMVFHELSHQVAFANGDTMFNESFATTVERIGAQRWLQQHADPRVRSDYEQFDGRRNDFRELVLRYRGEFETLYRSSRPDEDKRRGKAELLQRLRDDYAVMKRERWGGFAGYDGWFERVNNAVLGGFASYHQLTADFERLFERQGRDFERFYAEVRRLAALPKDERDRALQQP